MFVLKEQDDLGIVGMIGFRRQRIPKAWSTSPYKRVQRFERALLFGGDLLHNSLHLVSRTVGQIERGIFRKENVNVREIGQVLGKELLFQIFPDDPACNENPDGRGQHQPAVSNEQLSEVVVPGSNAATAAL